MPHASKTGACCWSDLRGTCVRCHAEIEERAGARALGAPDEGRGRRAAWAATSRTPASDAELLTGGEIRRCLTCHETMRHGHPLGEDRIDPRTGKGITCVTCHDPHGTDFPMHLRGDQTRGLCLECHQTDH